MPILPLDPRKIHTRSIFERTSKLKEGEMAAPYARGMTVLDFFQCLPDQLSAKGLKDLACSILEAKGRGAPVLLGIGGHVIKVSKFVILQLTLLVLANLLMYVSVDLLGIHYMAAVVAVSILAAVINFTVMRLAVFEFRG